MSSVIRKGVAFNPHWIDGRPAWDIRLINGDIHRSVTDSVILRVSQSNDQMVRISDVEKYAEAMLAAREG